jgi:hypothetical protein
MQSPGERENGEHDVSEREQGDSLDSSHEPIALELENAGQTGNYR